MTAGPPAGREASAGKTADPGIAQFLDVLAQRLDRRTAVQVLAERMDGRSRHAGPPQPHFSALELASERCG
jgi:hypothetical protein